MYIYIPPHFGRKESDRPAVAAQQKATRAGQCHCRPALTSGWCDSLINRAAPRIHSALQLAHRVAAPGRHPDLGAVERPALWDAAHLLGADQAAVAGPQLAHVVAATGRHPDVGADERHAVGAAHLIGAEEAAVAGPQLA